MSALDIERYRALYKVSVCGAGVAVDMHKLCDEVERLRGELNTFNPDGQAGRMAARCIAFEDKMVEYRDEVDTIRAATIAECAAVVTDECYNHEDPDDYQEGVSDSIDAIRALADAPPEDSK